MVIARCHGSRQRVRAFFDGWTRKEVFIKAVGEGLSYPLDRFDVPLAPGKPAALLAVASDAGRASGWLLRGLEPAPGFAGALAAPGRGWQVYCWASSPAAWEPA
jgi:4'-phosphopantetheinyl transferase